MANASIIKERLKAHPEALEQEWDKRTIVSTREKGKKYVLDFGAQIDSAVYRIDGCLISEGRKCDRLIMADNAQGQPYVMVFVELKGSGIEHAIDQIEQTLRHKFFYERPDSNDVIMARIVTNRGVSSAANGCLNKAQQRFKSLYNCNIRVVKSNSPDRMPG